MSRRRIVVAGGSGFFGASVVGRLRADGFEPIVASRHGGTRLDVEDASSIRATLRGRDVVVDAAGPFQARTDTLARLADEVGFDLIDLSDSLAYCERVLALAPRRARILTACSTISAVTAMLVRKTGIDRPERITTILVPEASASSRPAAARSMLRSVGKTIRMLRGGALVPARGWEKVEDLDAGPFGRLTGHRMETADAVMLPRIWPSLRDVDFLVATRMGWLDAVVGMAATCRLTGLLGWGPALSLGLPLARLLAPRGSGYFVHVTAGETTRSAAIVADLGGHVAAAIPAALAAEALAEDRADGQGLILPDRCFDADRLDDALARLQIRRMD